MASFWCGNILPKGYFKNTKTCQNIWGQQVVRPFSFNLLNLEEFNQIDSLSTPKDERPVFDVVISETFRLAKSIYIV